MHRAINYRGFDIEYNFYGTFEYTIQYCGDDIEFLSLDEAKEFVDELLDM